MVIFGVSALMTYAIWDIWRNPDSKPVIEEPQFRIQLIERQSFKNYSEIIIFKDTDTDTEIFVCGWNGRVAAVVLNKKEKE